MKNIEYIRNRQPWQRRGWHFSTTPAVFFYNVFVQNKICIVIAHEFCINNGLIMKLLDIANCWHFGIVLDQSDKR
jgi:hypothetical protein